MIIRFIFDYLISLFTPFNSCLVLFNIDKAKIYQILCIGFISDILFGKFIILLILIFLWILFKKFSIKNSFIKNIFILIINYVLLFVFNKFNMFFAVSCLVFMLFYFLYEKYII